MSEQLIEIQFETNLSDMESCPICHCHNLRLEMWSADRGEIEAVECNECHCAAPVATWNNGRGITDFNIAVGG